MYIYSKTTEGRLRIEGNDEPTREFYLDQIRDIIANTENAISVNQAIIDELDCPVSKEDPNSAACVSAIFQVELAENSLPTNQTFLDEGIKLGCLDEAPE